MMSVINKVRKSRIRKFISVFMEPIGTQNTFICIHIRYLVSQRRTGSNYLKLIHLLRTSKLFWSYKNETSEINWLQCFIGTHSHITFPCRHHLSEMFHWQDSRKKNTKQKFLCSLLKLQVGSSINGHDQFIINNIPAIDSCPSSMSFFQLGKDGYFTQTYDDVH